MKITNAYIKTLIATAMTTATLSSCIYEDNDDCVLDMRVKLRYDMNMKFADAFANEVKTVNLYAYDQNGKLALKKTETVSGSDFTINVSELQPEQPYNFIAWAEGTQRTGSYTYGDSNSETSLGAKIARSSADITTDLTPLFHARTAGVAFERTYNTTQTQELSLTKDTKNIKVVLQQQDSSEPINTDDFTLTITDDNGSLNYDNSVAQDEQLTYHPWSVTTGEAGVDEGETKVGALIAEFTVNRLVKEGHNPRLNVFNKSGERILSIPLIDYMLLVKGNYNSSMTDQEYLDRQDTYDMVFFLSNGTWLNSVIYINSWRVVLQNSTL